MKMLKSAIVNYEELIPVLIKGMQEQSEIIKLLNERIAKLEIKILHQMIKHQ